VCSGNDGDGLIVIGDDVLMFSLVNSLLLVFNLFLNTGSLFSVVTIGLLIPDGLNFCSGEFPSILVLFSDSPLISRPWAVLRTATNSSS